ncbi:hypothetical protein GLOTRDRAFT_137595 [Gloeophyllum trabeum ATCC 11539]|uniref:PH domain-containing protein n=1 Tax=Gloeophyllum trabeum (strain ATCC 11539 / FP-39264 / Madison 617) TaxID=670483 RepID=S7RVD8_GLOTA|nr:uncharacterized protein GLOTRDRAFT_137595 [Gloeophyllum trabeum ATCC 11539]EPQ57209.1 hypothetical protein GLOTRDRAFT_137595 [Gloeophyllum trabeum ATCC 11539]
MTRNNSSTEESDELPTPSSVDSLGSPFHNGSSSQHGGLAKPQIYEGYTNLPTVVETGEEPESMPSRGSSGIQAWQTIYNDTPPLRSKKSTKELVNRYEAIGSEPGENVYYPGNRPQNQPWRPAQDKALPQPPALTFQSRNGKPRSPLRQSFRNLISVFKKSRIVTKDKPAMGNSMLMQYPGVRPQRATSNYPDRPGLPSIEALPRGPSVSPARLLTNTLLHLSRPVTETRSSPLLPNNPLSHTVPLAGCTDVRSIPLSDLYAAERAMLPSLIDTATGARGTPGEPKVFELVFEIRRKEIFAAASVKERAAWVSAIWDAVLNSQDRRSLYAPEQSDYSDTKYAHAQNIHCVSQQQSDPPEETAIDASTRPSQYSMTDRSLPSTPVTISSMDRRRGLSVDARVTLSAEGMSSRTGLQLSNLQKSISDPPRQPSPSIQNLDRRSMVKMRLAELEGGTSNLPVHKLRPPPKEFTQAKGTHPATTELTGAERVSRNSADTIRRPATDDPDTMPVLSPALCDSQAQVSRSSPPFVSRTANVISSGHNTAFSQNEAAVVAATPDQAINGDGICKEVARSRAFEDIKDMLRTLLERVQQPLDMPRHQEDSHLQMLHSMVGEIRAQLHQNPAKTLDMEGPSTVVCEKVNQVHHDVQTGVIKVLARIDELRRCGHDRRGVLGEEVQPQAHLATKAMDGLNDKLDTLLRAVQVNQESGKAVTDSKEAFPLTCMKELTKCMELLRETKTNQVVYLDNQADSVRYLNELNSWLETFVNHGVSQIQTLAEDIQALRKDLNPANGSRMQNVSSTSLSRSQSNKGLLSSLEEVVENLKKAGHTSDASTIATLLERQHTEQERLNFADSKLAGISRDIRGERLRFVEAMKEATTINVQSHIEQFRQDLTREVLRLSQASEAAGQYRRRQIPSESHQSGLVTTSCSQSSYRLSDGGPRPKSSHRPQGVYRRL